MKRLADDECSGNSVPFTLVNDSEGSLLSHIIGFTDPEYLPASDEGDQCWRLTLLETEIDDVDEELA